MLVSNVRSSSIIIHCRRKRKITNRFYNVYFMQSIFRKVVLRVHTQNFRVFQINLKSRLSIVFFSLLFAQKMHLYTRYTIYTRDYVRKKKRKTMHALKIKWKYMFVWKACRDNFFFRSVSKNALLKSSSLYVQFEMLQLTFFWQQQAL